MWYKCILVSILIVCLPVLIIVLVWLPVLLIGQYTLRGVPESYAVLNENFRLQCDVTDSPSGVEFLRNNIVECSISPTCASTIIDNRYKCGCIGSKHLYLNISNINKQDDTTWSCKGNSGKQGSTYVPVYYGPENMRFNLTSDKIDVIEGKSQSVNCLADCKPDCNINWSKDGSTTILNNPLSLSTRDQTGSYTCTVTHTVLNKQLTKQLNVQIHYGPENIRFNPTSDNIYVIEGKSQSVNCLANCQPDCNITWSKDGSTAILNNPLSLSTRDQTGSYNCTVTHTVLNEQLTKQLHVQMYYGPDELTFSPNVTSINIIEGRNQTITCLTDCYKCNYKWTGPVSSSTKDLVLTQIKRNQEGIYTCEATNVKNTNPKTRSKSILVNVHYPPKLNNCRYNSTSNSMAVIMIIAILAVILIIRN